MLLRAATCWPTPHLVTWRVLGGGFQAGEGGHRYLVLDKAQSDSVSGLGGDGATGLVVDMAGEEEGKTKGSGEEEER